MPCMDGGPTRDQMDAERINQLTEDLCYVLSRAERGDKLALILKEKPTLAKWWANHKAEDAKREARERAAAKNKRERDAARESALSKLTDAERAALGLNR
jgi:hypothetical protein